jgi:hypothetical protein
MMQYCGGTWTTDVTTSAVYPNGGRCSKHSMVFINGTSFVDVWSRVRCWRLSGSDLYHNLSKIMTVPPRMPM